MTEKQVAVIQSLAPLTSAILFAFSIYVGREWITSVQAEQAAHAAAIIELQQTSRERAVKLQFIEMALKEIKDTVHRIEDKVTRR